MCWGFRGKDMLWCLDPQRKEVQRFTAATHPSERQAIDLTTTIGRQNFDEITLGQGDQMIAHWLDKAIKNDNGFQTRKQFADHIKVNSKLVFINQMLCALIGCESMETFEDFIAPIQSQFNFDNFKQFVDKNPARRNVHNPPPQIQRLAQDLVAAMKRFNSK